MGFLNKERIVLLIALVIAAYGLLTAFGGGESDSPVPEIPVPSTEREVPPMAMVKPKFLRGPFEQYWGTEGETAFRNPWVLPKTTVELTERDFPMPQPRLAPMATVVPPPPYAPVQEVRKVIRQLKPPKGIDETSPEQPGDEGATGGGE